MPHCHPRPLSWVSQQRTAASRSCRPPRSIAPCLPDRTPSLHPARSSGSGVQVLPCCCRDDLEFRQVLLYTALHETVCSADWRDRHVLWPLRIKGAAWRAALLPSSGAPAAVSWTRWLRHLPCRRRAVARGPGSLPVVVEMAQRTSPSAPLAVTCQVPRGQPPWPLEAASRVGVTAGNTLGVTGRRPGGKLPKGVIRGRTSRYA
jgi:hypothetical protein